MKKFIFLIILVVLIGGGLVAYKTYDEAVHYVANVESPISFSVTEGESFNTLLVDLEEVKLVKNKEIIKLYLKINDINPEVKAGDYLISKGELSLSDLISILEKGVFKPGIKVTLKEGLRMEKVAEAFVEQLGSSAKFDKSEFISFVQSPNRDLLTPTNRAFLEVHLPSGKPLEGFLFPDTYEFLPEQTTIEIINVLVDHFITKINENISLSNLNLTQTEVTTLYEAVILASIIEKEASNNNSQPGISSVFHNRLREGIRLQSDATIVYFTGRDDFITSLADTEIDNPYNTYRIDGLTPTPINSPGINSIKAALYPETSDYYYFFYDKLGIVYYSRTFEEHSAKANEILTQ